MAGMEGMYWRYSGAGVEMPDTEVAADSAVGCLRDTGAIDGSLLHCEGSRAGLVSVCRIVLQRKSWDSQDVVDVGLVMSAAEDFEMTSADLGIVVVSWACPVASEDRSSRHSHVLRWNLEAGG